MELELFGKIQLGLILYIILACSVSLHEWGHAFMADKLGDPIPRAQGRVTLNPIAHMDMLGTVIFPLVMIFLPIFLGMTSGFFLFGWGKPVIVSLPNPKTRKRDDMLITAAGPFMNLMICLVVALVGAYIAKPYPQFIELIYLVITLNAALFVFNLIPIPPLDGSHFLKYALNMSEQTYYSFARWGFFIILILINLAPFRYALHKGIAYVSGWFTPIIVSQFV